MRDIRLREDLEEGTDAASEAFLKTIAVGQATSITT
jgi:hypothetical protein